jgi:hypothetical protein
MTSPLRVFVCGEGPNELGSRHGAPSFQSDKHPGVLESLLRRARDSGWEIVGAINWRLLPKLRARGPSPDEGQQVARLMLMAQDDYKADVLAYIRDADDEKQHRCDAHRRGKEEGAELAPSLKVVGEIAAPSIEGWILALLGVRKTEEMTVTKATRLLAEKGIEEKDTAAMVRVVEACPDLTKVPTDAKGLRTWSTGARSALASHEHLIDQ